MNIPPLACWHLAGTLIGWRRKGTSWRKNSLGQSSIGEFGGFVRGDVWLSKLPNHLYRNYASPNNLSAWFCERIYKQLLKLQQYVCWSKMLLRSWLGWRCNSLWARDYARAINKLAYVYQKRLGYTSRHNLCSLLQCLHAWYSICFEQISWSGPISSSVHIRAVGRQQLEKTSAGNEQATTTHISMPVCSCKAWDQSHILKPHVWPFEFFLKRCQSAYLGWTLDAL